MFGGKLLSNLSDLPENLSERSMKMVDQYDSAKRDYADAMEKVIEGAEAFPYFFLE